MILDMVWYVSSTSTLTNLTNSGTISGTSVDDGAYGVFVSSTSTLTNLTNTGIISGTAGDDSGYGVQCSGCLHPY